jgi:hypothetical protein
LSAAETTKTIGNSENSTANAPIACRQRSLTSTPLPAAACAGS